MLENVVKCSEFVYTREQRYTKVIYYYYYFSHNASLSYLHDSLNKQKSQVIWQIWHSNQNGFTHLLFHFEAQFWPSFVLVHYTKSSWASTRTACPPMHQPTQPSANMGTQGLGEYFTSVWSLGGWWILHKCIYCLRSLRGWLNTSQVYCWVLHKCIVYGHGGVGWILHKHIVGWILH